MFSTLWIRSFEFIFQVLIRLSTEIARVLHYFLDVSPLSGHPVPKFSLSSALPLKLAKGIINQRLSQYKFISSNIMN